MHNYSIAEAKNNLSRLVHEVEGGQAVNLTRRGELVAVLLSAEEYKKINQIQPSPADALKSFLNEKDHKKVDIDPALFEGLRIKESGRDISL